MDTVFRKTLARLCMLAGCGTLVGAMSPSITVVVGCTLVLMGVALWME